MALELSRSTTLPVTNSANHYRMASSIPSIRTSVIIRTMPYPGTTYLATLQERGSLLGVIIRW